jgi:hypothetical protein
MQQRRQYNQVVVGERGDMNMFPPELMRR